MIEFIVIVLTVISVVGVLVFGMLAASQIDREKTGVLSKTDLRFFGPLVPEKILKPRGLKWAKLRNGCVIVAFVLPTAFAILKPK